MAKTITMPQLSSTMEKGTIVQWLKQVGETVTEGEALIEITTDKVDVEVESPESGVLLQTLVDIGDEVPVKDPVAVIGEAGEEVGEVAAEAVAETTEEEVKQEKQEAATGGKIFASPRARRLAKEANIDIANVTGTGPKGRIVSQDVRMHAEKPKQPVAEAKPVAAPKTQAAPAAKPKSTIAAGQVIQMSPIQKMVADRLSMSYRTAPHINLLMDANCEKMVDLRDQLKAQGLKVSYNDIIAKFTSVVLKEFPRFNSMLAEDGIHLLEDINIGIAVAAGEDLVVPVVKNVDKRDIAVIASESARLIAAARDGKLALDDITGGTLTITNLGMFGVKSFSPIINPPQAAILALGAIEPRAVVVPGHIIAQQMTTLSLSIDHRIVNGAQGGEFLARLKELIETSSLDVLMNRL